MSTRRALQLISIVILGSIIGIALRLSGATLSPPVMALLCGLSILCASFLLTWACDAVQPDMSRSLSLAVLALIAVLPEYAVDMYFTWKAGRQPESGYALYAVANMTGANRLLLGFGWSFICFLTWLSARRPVVLEPNQRTEVLFLGLATAYAFVIPAKGTLAWYDGVILIAIYVWYIALASQKPHEEAEEGGPVEFLLHLPTRKRRLSVVALFALAGLAIFSSSEPFCEGLVQTGKILHINEFFLVQWLAPIASETPEFIVALIFAMRGRPELSIATLLSSKLNQWTLLVGMIPGVYGLAHGSFDHPIPMGPFQMHEILLTAAQSLLGVAILANLSFDISEAIMLFVLFTAQLVSPAFVSHGKLLGIPAELIHPVFSALYVLLAIWIIFLQRRALWQLRWGGSFAVTRRGGELTATDQPPASR